MARLPRDENRIPVIGAISSADSTSLVILEAEPSAKALNVNISGDDTGITITNAIDSTAFDLNAAAFSTTTNISNDYILERIELNFSTTESKTITITTADGTNIYKDTNTNKDVSLVDINSGFNGGVL